MSNIHRLNDGRNNNNNGGGGGGGFGNMGGGNMNFFSGAGGTSSKDPGDETFWDMIHLNLCPQLTFFSFSVIFTLILILFFGFQLGIDGIDKQDPKRISSELLPIYYDGSLTDNLDSQYLKVRENFQIYRFITSLFLHSNIWHLLSNCLMMIIWTSYFEIFLTPKKMAIFFFLSGFIGNCFAVVINGPSVTSMGASTGIFGIMGAAAGFLIFNWNNLDYQGSPRGVWLCQVLFISILSFFFASSGVNTMAHLGGFLAGIFVGMFLALRHEKPGGNTVEPSGYEKNVRIAGMISTFLLFTICFLVLML